MTNISFLWSVPALAALGLTTIAAVYWLYKNSKPVPSLTKDEIISTALTCMQSDEQQRMVHCKTCKLADICINKEK